MVSFGMKKNTNFLCVGGGCLGVWVCVSLRVRKDGTVNVGIGAERAHGRVRSLGDSSLPVWLSEAEACLRPGPKFTAAQLSHPL